MDQTPAHDRHNPQLRQIVPVDARTIIEVGCSSGALAREYKKSSPTCRYIGVEVMPQYALLARRYCDTVHELDIEGVDAAFLRESLMGDCWVFGDAWSTCAILGPYCRKLGPYCRKSGALFLPTAASSPAYPMPSTGAFRRGWIEQHDGLSGRAIPGVCEKAGCSRVSGQVSRGGSFLDTLPYNAGTTASDALWAGLPVLTCAGEAFASRVAASLLHAVDFLPELIASTPEQYAVERTPAIVA